MYIKAIHITGFRSYRDRTVIDDFSRRFNVVVGQNGSGKSNFFAAIQFVLSEEFAHLSAEDRQNLLHEGTGNRSTVANVEIVFDNSDRRLAAFESHEFVISRQITAKKDQYFIDGRLSTRAEISSLMEAAGFSRSNPYYIVKQGKIAELAVATDLTRLKLLREVAGTRIYDEKKRESMDLLIVTDDQIAKSKVLLNYMDDRLVTLEEEKEELKEYQRCDKIRRALEYTLLNGDVRECKKEFDHCMRKRQELQMTLNEAENTKFEKSKAVNAAELEMRTLETREKCLVEEKNNARAEEDKFKEQRDFSVMKTTDLQELVDRVQHGKDDSEKQLTELSVVIKQKEDELKALKPRYEELVKLKAQYEGDYNIASRKLNNLYAKSDNSFASVEERDKYLKQKIIETQNYLIDSRKHIEDMQQALNDEHETMNSAGQRITEIEMQINEHVSRVDTMINEDDENRSILNRKTQVLHRKVAERRSIQERISELEAQNDHLNSSFHQSLPKSTADGIRSVDSILADLKLRNTDGRYNEYLNGYHGIVIKLMESDSQYFKALETTAGGNLAYHVVDTVEIALYLLQQMNDRHLRGEANFFPLNRVFSPELRDLRDKSNGRPLLSVIKYDHKFHAVFRQIFGGTILVKDIAAGRAISRNERFDCITLDGDQVSSAGPMTGGYVDIRKSKLDIVMNIKKIEPEIYELKERYKALTNEYVREENEVESLKYALQKNDEQRELIRRTHEQISTEKRELTEMRQRVGLNIERGNEDLLSLHRKSRELEAQIAELNRQIGTSLQDESIKEEIQKASDELKEKGQKFNDVSNDLSELAVHKKKLESELNSCLYRRREEYVQKANAIDFEVKRNELQNSMMETKKLQEQVAECYQRSLKLQDELGEVRSKILELRHNLENLVEQRNNADEIITNNTSEIEGLRRKMTELMKKRDESNQKLKDLGTLPVDMITQFAGMRKSEIEEQWRDSRKNLSKYNNINRKALDQYVRSATERDELKNQIVELEKSHEQISKLLEATETRKYDVLYLTFKQVAKNFHDVFNKLVPQGAGDLVMKTAPIDQNDPDALEKTRTMHVMERFIGVAIRVNFNDTSAEGFREAITLSGGQKTLVALGLIFAIQKCDPAPFYLFDEIDAALDREKRAAVASLIDEFSCSAQFISTTFRPEMLVHANRCYGVRFRNKISYISLINPDDAVEFLSKDDEIEETNHQNVENMDVM